jgi:hypothetical protein
MLKTLMPEPGRERHLKDVFIEGRIPSLAKQEHKCMRS